jgi:hypothetical protein
LRPPSEELAFANHDAFTDGMRKKGGEFDSPLVTRMVSVLIGLLFLASVIGKLRNPNTTLAVMQSVWGLGVTESDALFVLLAATEAALAIALLVSLSPRVVLSITAGFVLLLTSRSAARRRAAGSWRNSCLKALPRGASAQLQSHFSLSRP